MFAMAGSEPFDDLLRLLDHKWVRFWAWLETFGRNAPPLPSSHATEQGRKGRTKSDA